MTGDEFSSRFRLVEKLTEAGVTTYRGTDSQRGGVLVHLMPGPETPTPQTLAERGMTLAAIDELAWHECFDVEGMRVVVTADLDDFTRYETWIEGVEERAHAFGGGGTAGKAASTAAQGDAEETEPKADGDSEEMEPQPDPGVESEPAESGHSDAEAPGEFTRLMSSSELEDAAGEPSERSASESDAAMPSTPPAPPSPLGDPEAPSTDALRPDDQTTDQPDPGVEVEPGEPGHPNAEAPGEFTRLMSSSELEDAAGEPSERAAPKSDAATSSAPPAPPSPLGDPEAPSTDPPRPDDERTEQPEGASSEVASHPPAGAASPEAQDGPGEYTRIMMQLEGIEAPAPPPPSPPEEERGRERETSPSGDARSEPEAVPAPAPEESSRTGSPESSAPPAPREESPPVPEEERRDVGDVESDEGPGPYTRLMRRSGGGADDPPSHGGGSLPYRRPSSDVPAGEPEAGGGSLASDGGDGYLDRLRGGGADRPPSPPPRADFGAVDDGAGAAAGSPPAPPSPSRASSGPSEYTRIIRGDREARPAPRTEPTAAAPPTPGRRSRAAGSTKKPIVIALVVVVLILVAIVVYFALWGPAGG